MDKMENQNQESGTGQQTINIQVPSADNIASRRSLIPLLFAAVIIFFFFNFFTVSCGGQKVGSVTGINLVTGTELKDRDMFSGRETKGEKIPSSAWAIIAFGAAIIGLGAFLIKEKREALIGTGAGAIGFGSLLILQFAIKNAIEKKAEGAIQTDFQFAYWAALIAMGIAGFISYLRMQKTHNIVVSVVPPSTHTTPNAENINQPIASINPIQQTNNFDIGAWLGKNIKIILSVFGVLAVLFGIYYFFLKPNPTKDAKNVAAAYCDCATKYNDAMIKANEDFIKSFDSYNFKKRQEARNKLQELQNVANSDNSNCNNAVQQKYNEKRNKFISNKELLEKFDFAYNAQSVMCNPSNQSKLSSLYTEIENKISSIKVSEPDIEKVKRDLLGHKIFASDNYHNWNFAYLEEFKNVTILNSSISSTYLELRIDMDLSDYKTNEPFKANVIVTYTLNGDEWVFDNVKATYYEKVGGW